MITIYKDFFLADAKESAKQCFKNELATAGVNFDMKDVRECLKQCVLLV